VDRLIQGDKEVVLIQSALRTGTTIDDFANAIEQAKANGELGEVETPLTHYHTEDLYGRRIVVPAGSVFTTRVHKHDHISVALRGHIFLLDQEGRRVKEVIAPDVFVTKAGTHRIVYVYEEIEFLTVHHCEEQDDDKVEDLLGYKTMKEYEALRLEAPV
jgi:hypothetical protein